MEERVWHKSYDAGVSKQVTFEELPIPQFLESSAAQFSDSPALLFLNCKLTYRELKREVDRLAAALSELGVKKDRLRRANPPLIAKVAPGPGIHFFRELIRFLLAAMYAKAPYTVISRGVAIHPTVSELLPTVLQSLKPLQ